MADEPTLEQVADDWLDPDFQYEGSCYDEYDWSYDYESEPSYERGPDLNIPWREQPYAPTSQEVLAPYTTQKSWWDSLGDFFKDIGPTAIKIAETFLNSGSARSGTSVLSTPTKAPGTVQPIILQSGSTQPVFFQTPAAETGSPNYLLYAAIAAAAYFLLKVK